MSASTHADLLRGGAATLQAAGLEDAHTEARRLLCLVAGYSAATLIARELDPASEDLQAAFEMAVSMRGERHPFAHIAGRAGFYGLDLLSDGRALIPRADSECVVDLALTCLPDQTALQVADLGTGSGALLAALLSHRPEVRGSAIERSAAALSLAAENFERLALENRVELVPGSWSDWDGWSQCDLIISNPPYICSEVIETLAPEVRDHDPMEALDGGMDGLAAYREIIALAAEAMKPGAYLVFEIGFDQKFAVSALLEQQGFTQLQHRQDLGGNDRAIAALKS